MNEGMALSLCRFYTYTGKGMKKQRIALDFHSVLNHLLDSLIARYNADHGSKHIERHGRLLTYADCTAWDLTQYTVIGAEIYGYFAQEATHLDAPPVPYAQEVTRLLAEAGHDLAVVTDSVMVATIWQYLGEHYPHIDRRERLYRVPNRDKVAFCRAMGFDTLVEDHVENTRGGEDFTYLITTPYNAADTRFPLCRRVGPIDTAWLEIGARLGVLQKEAYSDDSMAARRIVSYSYRLGRLSPSPRAF